MSNIVLASKNLHKTFIEAKMRTEVLKGVDIDIKSGEKVAIVGASGSGKSTLLHLLGGLDHSTSGEVLMMGQSLKDLATEKVTALREQYLGFVYQFHHLLPEFTALENVMLPLALRKQSLTSAREEAKNILARVGLSHRYEHRPSELSGGERQRVAIARALVKKPLCVLADEPTGNLDHKTAAGVWELLLELNQDYGTALLVVTHDERLTQHVDRVLRMSDGLII
jgi:lipoprotein-releasing system ATP-binding protein